MSLRDRDIQKERHERHRALCKNIFLTWKVKGGSLMWVVEGVKVTTQMALIEKIA